MYIKRWSFGGARDELRPRMVGAAAATTSPPLDWSNSFHASKARLEKYTLLLPWKHAECSGSPRL